MRPSCCIRYPYTPSSFNWSYVSSKWGLWHSFSPGPRTKRDLCASSFTSTPDTVLWNPHCYQRQWCNDQLPWNVFSLCPTEYKLPISPYIPMHSNGYGWEGTPTHCLDHQGARPGVGNLLPIKCNLDIITSFTGSSSLKKFSEHLGEGPKHIPYSFVGWGIYV